MRTKMYIILLFILTSTSCKNKNEERSMNQSLLSQKELERNIKSKGDIDSYNSLKLEYMESVNKIDFLPWALLMANKFGYQQAYFDVFWILYEKQKLSEECDYSLNRLDNNDKQLALNNLIMAAKLGHLQAKEILGKYYMQGRYVIKDTILGKQLLAR